MDGFLAKLKLQVLSEGIVHVERSYTSDPEAQELLKKDPDEIIDKAEKGCLLACELILTCFEGGKRPLSMFSRALKVLATHVEDGCDPEKASEREFHLAEQSFNRLCIVMEFHLVKYEPPPLQPIVKAWPSLLMFAKAHYVQNAFPYKGRIKPSSHLAAGEEGLSMLLQGVYLLGGKNDILRRVAFHPTLVELATYVLIRSHREVHKSSCNSYFIVCLTNANTSKRREILDAILQGCEGKPEAFIDSFMSPFLTCGPFEEACSVVEIFRFISKAPGHPMDGALKVHGLDPLSKFTEFLAEGAETATPHFMYALSDWMGIFSSYWKPQDGRAWLIKFLRCRLFRLIATHDPLRKEAFIRELLSTHLPGHLTDPFMIYECESALAAHTPEDFSKIMKSNLKSEWMMFINRFFEQYLFYCYFEAAGYRKGCYKCSKIPDNKKPGGLLTCGACKTVGYCSKKCQTAGWKDHKTDCKTLKGKKYGPIPRWAAPIFRRRLAAHDARRHFPSFRALAQEKCPFIPFQCVCVLIDYRHYPPRLNIGSATEFDGGKCHSPSPKEEEIADPALQEECFDNFRINDGGSGTLISCEFIEGERSVRTQGFYWTPPYFCSPYGTKCPDVHKRKSIVTPFLGTDKKNNKKLTKQDTVWSPVDELAFRTGLKPEMILEGKIGEFRRKVLEVVVRERARESQTKR